MSSLGTLEAENELRQFLKLARPEWSKPRRNGPSDVARVLAKLKDIGITDIDSLVRGVDANTINEDLVYCSHLPLSREALDAIRKQRGFIQAMENVDVPNVRQVGVYDNVAQLLSRKRVVGPANSGKTSSPKDLERLNPSRSMESFCGSSSTAGQQPNWSTQSMMSMSSSQVGSLRLRGAKPPNNHGRSRRQPLMSGGMGASQSDLDSIQGDGPLSPMSSGTSQLPSKMLMSSKALVSWSAENSAELDGAERTPLSAAVAPMSATATGGFRSLQRAVSAMSISSSMRARATSGSFEAEFRPATPPLEEMILQHQATLKASRNEDRSAAARWSQRSLKTPLEQGEDMLREQQAIDEHKRFVRQVTSSGRKAGQVDPFRSHIAHNIKLRLKEEAKRDNVEGLAMNQHCMNIRKQLASMVNARKELAGLRQKVHTMLEGDADLSMLGSIGLSRVSGYGASDM